ncbi:MAG: DNA polymerase sliding clamp, partial [Candidatus Diapherotrites archaeon]|nr:DNA polymerase sliding clamp [Candidatus Diapherotrites archaeon]
MTTLVLSDTRNWKRSIDAISALISEGNFDFAEDGVTFSAVDPSQVAFVDFFMPKSCFQEYTASNTSVGLDLIELSKVVARALPTDRLSISVEASDFLLKLQGTLTRRFKLPLLDLSSDDVPKPKSAFKEYVVEGTK